MAQAPAKVNFRLDVLRKRNDGYHDLRMIMQRIALYDDLAFELTDVPGISISCNFPFVPCDNRNIVWKAADRMLQLSTAMKGLRINLQKKIPVGAGLGGGSSDAATTLMALNEMLELNLTDEDLMAIGLELGADVPFFIYKKTAIAEGIGEVFTPIEEIPKLWLVLVYPAIHVATSWVYQNLSLTSERAAAKISVRYKSAAELCAVLANDLESVTVQRYPLITRVKEILIQSGALGSLMSGSGSSVFGVFADEESARRAVASPLLDDNWLKIAVPTI